MPPLIGPTLMEATWRSVGASSAIEMRRMQKQSGKDQEELTKFVLGFTSDLSEQALGLALYMHLVVSQAFRRSRAKFRKVTAAQIDRAWKDNFAVINELKSAGHAGAPFAFPSHLTSEPAALQYIVEALTEQDEADPISLVEHEFWQILQVLKTHCDCMHDAGTS